MTSIKRLLGLMVLIATSFLIFGCEDIDDDTPDESHPLAGNYVLSTKTINGVDLTENIVYSVIELIGMDQVRWAELDFAGLDIQEGTFELEGTTLSVIIGLRTYAFMLDEDEVTLSFVGRIDRREVTMTYQKNDGFTLPSTTGDASFENNLFGESLDLNFYNYAPSVILEGNDTMHVWFCGNGESGNVTDFIGYRKGTLQGDGTWRFSERDLVLSATEGTWDARHVCDPSVIKGDFTYHGTEYHYLMAYLGCVTNDSSRNEVGIAVAESIEGPWTKVDDVNPIANYYTSPEYVDDRWTWGFGQPSLVSVDHAGQVLLFYTKGVAGGTYQAVEHWNLSNLDNPVKLSEAQITNAGVVNASGGADVINNADFAYDPHTKRLYVIKEDFPYASGGGTDWLTGANTVMYVNLDTNESHIGQTLFAGIAMRWQVVRSIGTAETGFARVHNSGLVRDPYGWMIDPNRIPVVYTRADVSDDYPDWQLKGQWPSLHTYRLYGYMIDL